MTSAAALVDGSPTPQIGPRVLHVVATAQRRGAEVFASELIARLAERGVAQRVAVLWDADPGVTYDAPTDTLGVRRGGAEAGSKLDLRVVRGLRRVARKYGPDVIQAHGGEPLKYIVAAGLARRAPIVYRRIGAVSGWITNDFTRAVHSALVRRSAVVVAVAEGLRAETTEAFGVPAERVRVIPNGVDAERIAARRSPAETRRLLAIPEDAVVIASIGALAWEKNPLSVIEVAEATSSSNTVHVVVGEGPLREELERMVAERSLENRVLVLGARDDVGDILATSDVLMLPSDTEGMPGVLIEAGMHGVPAVAYEVGGVGDVILDGETGLLVPRGDLEGLTVALKRLIEDESLRSRFGRRAHQWCRANFEIGAIADRYLDLYSELIHQGSRVVPSS